MNLYKEQALAVVVNELRAMADKIQPGTAFAGDTVTAEYPPRPELGDLAFPMFGLAKLLRKAPPAIAVELAAALRGKIAGEAVAAGPYVNVKLDRAAVSTAVLTAVGEAAAAGIAYGTTGSLAGQKIMIEFSCPNTNKPLHLGHLRNDAIGESVARILAANGATLRKVNLINDRGIHICKSMLAYLEFGDGKTPESEGVKSDHFVGDYYVKYAEWEKRDKAAAEEGARKMLKAWEDGDPATIELWKTMNRWAIDGIKATYASTNISFDAFYYESETYKSGRDEVLRGLAEGVFFREADSSVQVDLSSHGLDRKVLLRADGTSLYITQDIGTAVLRHNDWPFDRLVYVVASEQNYHFQVLFRVLGLLGYEWAARLHHLSYGMVNLPSGKMKSREGTVVDADNLLDELVALAEKEIREREREGEIEDVPGTTKAVALGALNYYLLGTTPAKDMVFNPEESISFTGNTGPYLQYTGARISSILRKFEERKAKFAAGKADPALLGVPDEWELVKLVASFPDAVEAAGRDLNPSFVSLHLYELAKTFSRYYHDNPVLHNEDPNIVVTRIGLLRAIREVFVSGFPLIGVPYLERM
jgi:arginyl-tRNA synthetase